MRCSPFARANWARLAAKRSLCVSGSRPSAASQRGVHPVYPFDGLVVQRLGQVAQGSCARGAAGLFRGRLGMGRAGGLEPFGPADRFDQFARPQWEVCPSLVTVSHAWPSMNGLNDLCLPLLILLWIAGVESCATLSPHGKICSPPSEKTMKTLGASNGMTCVAGFGRPGTISRGIMVSHLPVVGHRSIVTRISSPETT